MPKDNWPIEGTKHHDLRRSSLYTNQKINNFLDNESETLLIATKGMGKTLLLRVRKKLFEDEPEGILLIPRNLEYDEPQFHGSLPKSGLDNVSFWEDLWKCSIVFSILSHRWEKGDFPMRVETLWDYIDELEIDDAFKNGLSDHIREGSKNNPSYYVNELLGKGIKPIQKFLRTIYKVDALSDKYINSSVAVFIDAFDQTMTRHYAHDLGAWRSAQLGLAKAAHRLNTQNRHIKVYASIRQEAYSGFSDDDREVIKGSSVLLNYSSDELRAIFEHGIRKYTQHKTIEEFSHLSEIRNGWHNEKENIFDYLYRHSTATPRAMIYLGKTINDMKLDLAEPTQIEQLLREEVNKTGAETIFKDYFLGQKKIFLNTLNSEESIKKLLSLIPSNVLHGKSLISINHEFSRQAEINEADSHPFCELYNIGLLGTIRNSPSTNKHVQYFRKPYEFNWVQREIVKKSEEIYYLVHPSLHLSITEERSKYYLNPTNIIGDERPWKIDAARKIFPLLFISHSSVDKEMIEKILPHFELRMNLTLPVTLWYDKWSIRVGDNIHQEIEKGVEGSDFVIVFVSKDSLKSGWVDKEWRKKHFDEISSNHIQVIAVIIDDTKPSQLPGFLNIKKTILLPLYDEADLKKEISTLCNDIGHHLFSNTTWGQN